MIKKVISLKNYKFSIVKTNNSVYTFIYGKIFYIVIKNNTKNILHLLSVRSMYLVIQDILLKLDENDPLRLFLAQFIKYKTFKIKFTGKGYKIKKPTKKSFRFLFNKSHICVIWWKNMHYKKFKKYKTYIRSTNLPKSTVNKILNIRYIDVFTKKGLRLSKSIIYKKKGKK